MPLGGSELTGRSLAAALLPSLTHTCTHLSCLTHTHAAGYKGYGLAMMVEMICGVLGGGPYAHHIREWTVADRVANLVWTDSVWTQPRFYSSIFSSPFQSHSHFISTSFLPHLSCPLSPPYPCHPSPIPIPPASFPL